MSATPQASTTEPVRSLSFLVAPLGQLSNTASGSDSSKTRGRPTSG